MIRDSSNLDETSSDEELSDWQHDDMTYVQRMMDSKNPSDQRLLKLYQVKQANHAGIDIGFKNQDQIKSIHQRQFPNSMQTKDDLHLSISNALRKEPTFGNITVLESQSRSHLDLDKSQIELVPLAKESHQLSMHVIEMAET